MASIINWTKDDKRALQKAVNNFNSKIRRLEKAGFENLPEKTSLRKLTNINDLENRQAIYSRRELNATIKRLQRFSERNVEKPVRLANGEIVSYYEKREIDIAKSRAVRRINKEIKILENKEAQFGMGSSKLEVLKGTRRKILDVENRKGADYREVRELLNYNAYADRSLRQSNIWKQNFINSLKESNLKNKNLLIKKLNSIKNPEKAYEYVSRSEVLKDLWIYYREDANAQTYGGFETNQEAFDYGLQQIGLLNM